MEIITTLITSVIGGLLVAIVNHLLTKKKTEAEIEKIKAETEKIRSETKHLLGKANYYDSTKVDEVVIYDGTQGIHGFDIASEYSQFHIQQGVVVIQNPDVGFKLRKYTYNEKEFLCIPKNELIDGERKFHVSCEFKAIEALYNVTVFMWDELEEDDSIDDHDVEISENVWNKHDYYFRVSPNKNYNVRILAVRLDGSGSLQIRGLTVTERIA